MNAGETRRKLNLAGSSFTGEDDGVQNFYAMVTLVDALKWLEQSGPTQSAVALFDATNTNRERRMMIKYSVEEFNKLTKAINQLYSYDSKEAKNVLETLTNNHISRLHPSSQQELLNKDIGARFGALSSFNVISEQHNPPTLIIRGLTLESMYEKTKATDVTITFSSDANMQRFSEALQNEAAGLVEKAENSQAVDIDVGLLANKCVDEHMLGWNWASKVYNGDNKKRSDALFDVLTKTQGIDTDTNRWSYAGRKDWYFPFTFIFPGANFVKYFESDIRLLAAAMTTRDLHYRNEK